MTTETLHNGLKLLQTEEFHKLGQDSVLLADFAKPRRFSRVLDLGCGTGALALSLYRPDLKISALDIQEGAVELLRQSAALNGIEIDAQAGDLRAIRTVYRHGSFDYAVCNPPYFSTGCGKTSPEGARAAARSDGEATIEEVAAALSFVLHDGAKCALVFRPERLWALLNALQNARLRCLLSAGRARQRGWLWSRRFCAAGKTEALQRNIKEYTIYNITSNNYLLYK